MKNHNGFTLMEVLVGSVLLGIVVYGLSSVFLGAQRGALTVEKHSEFSVQMNTLNLALSNTNVCVPMLNSVAITGTTSLTTPFTFAELKAGGVQVFRTSGATGVGYLAQSLELSIDPLVPPWDLTHVDHVTGVGSEVRAYLGVLKVTSNLALESSSNKTPREIVVPIEMAFDQSIVGAGALKYCSSAYSFAMDRFPTKICEEGEYVYKITPTLIECRAPAVVTAPVCQDVKLPCTQQNPPPGFHIVKLQRIHGKDADAPIFSSYACKGLVKCEFVSGRWRGRNTGFGTGHDGHTAKCDNVARPGDGLEVRICPN